jgi:hypothetical protein
MNNDEIVEINSTKHTIDDIPSTGLQAMRLWFNIEETGRFISGNKYVSFNTTEKSLINVPSSHIIQTDVLDNSLLNIKESSVISDEIYNKIFALMLDSAE